MPVLGGLEHSPGKEIGPKEKKKITELHAVDLTYLEYTRDTQVNPEMFANWRATVQLGPEVTVGAN